MTKLPADSKFKAGQAYELSAADLETIQAAGHDYISEGEYTATVKAKKQTERLIIKAVDEAVKRGALVPKGDTEKSGEKVQANAMKQIEQGADADFVIGYIDGLPGKDETIMGNRVTPYMNDMNGNGRLDVLRADPKDCAIRACEINNKQFALLKTGEDGVKAASNLSREFSNILASEIMPLYRRGEDFSIKDIVRAADTTDANVGTIASGLILMRNLGFLKNIINFLPYISTDLRNEPAKYGQNVLSRYIVVPSVTSYSLPTNSGSGTTFTTTGGWSDSTPSVVDANVIINNHKGVQITFNTQLLGSTIRNLFAEQQAAQIYGLGEVVCTDFLKALFGFAWTGTVNQISIGQSFGLKDFVTLKNRMTLSKIPPIGRYALLHSTYHDSVLQDSNLVTAKAITALVNKDLSALESAELPVLYGIKPLESQLASYSTTATNTVGGVAGVAGTATATAATIGADGSVTFPGVNRIGFLGNMSSALMATRIPIDYTQAFKDIPSTAAIEVVTDPDSGLSMLNCRYVNHQLAQVSNRLSLMYGFGQGDPRIGICLTP